MEENLTHNTPCCNWVVECHNLFACQHNYLNINAYSFHPPLTGPENLKEDNNYRGAEKLRKTIIVRNLMIYFKFMIVI